MFRTVEDVQATYEVAFEKRAYGAKEHAELADIASKAVGGGKTSPAVAATVQRGALKVDQGIRHPWLPHTDPLHSFPGSQTRATLGKNIIQKQDMAVHDIAKSIATRGSALSGARAHRGLMNLGEGHHQLVDISAHTDKPLHEGTPTRLRGIMKGHESGYGGGIVSGREHVDSGVTRKGVDLHAELDKLRPDASAVDRQAISRSERFGSAVGKKVEARLVSHHGMHPTAAAEHAGHFFQQMHAPSLPSRVAGEASRNARYVGAEAGRLGSAVRGAGASVLRALRSRL